MSLNTYKLLRKVKRLLHTVRHLQPRQAWYFFVRRAIGSAKPAPVAEELSLRATALHDALRFNSKTIDTKKTAAHTGHTFSFLNHRVQFDGANIDWQPANASRLWRYNLHYFDYLADADRSLEEKCFLIDDWIAHNPPLTQPGWEPYTASLRIANWCRFFLSIDTAAIKPQWRQSLYQQACWLEKNLEWHILANHYFENIRALLFAAAFFATPRSQQWGHFFQRELVVQLGEQTLADGGHYERSPQYHCILLRGYLELFALGARNSDLLDEKINQRLHDTISAGLQFLIAIATPDDDIPHFNDSTTQPDLRPSHIFALATALGFAAGPGAEQRLIDKSVSGLFGWKDTRDYFLIDCGDIGPAYQPGHTHCDLLSFVLMSNNAWLIVDSGVFEYEPGAMRNYVRSTAAHNTIVVDDAEQSDVWGEFRVGQRAQRLDAHIRREGKRIVFNGAYRGFPAIAGGITHRRTAQLELDTAGNIRALDIIDDIDGSGDHAVFSLLHLHPDITPVIETGSVKLFRRDTSHNNYIGAIHFDAGYTATQQESWHCPQFGIRQRNSVIRLGAPSLHSQHVCLPQRMTYRITIADNASATVI